LRHSAAICTRASGRDSKITPSTPDRHRYPEKLEPLVQLGGALGLAQRIGLLRDAADRFHHLLLELGAAHVQALEQGFGQLALFHQVADGLQIFPVGRLDPLLRSLEPTGNRLQSGIADFDRGYSQPEGSLASVLRQAADLVGHISPPLQPDRWPRS
jgi:hypothetical protein